MKFTTKDRKSIAKEAGYENTGSVSCTSFVPSIITDVLRATSVTFLVAKAEANTSENYSDAWHPTGDALGLCPTGTKHPQLQELSQQQLPST